MNRIYTEMEHAREKAFGSIWSSEIDAVFSDVAEYYDRANVYATLSLIDTLRRRFLSTMEIKPGAKVLDVCAGTNVIGIGLLKKQPDLEVCAVDRSKAMQRVGRRLAEGKGLRIHSVICDVHELPFPDNYFDVVTLQWATRHLRALKVFSEIHRVLKPGGHFYHCDMLRPHVKVVEKLYCFYLKICLTLVSRAFGSGSTALGCRDYFVDAIRMFYSVAELSSALSELGFSDVVGRPMLAGTVGFHAARKSAERVISSPSM
ncbi:MAG TPA: class I SAM-dependent methyltransferase [Casimicrobiaceae bacterium]|jgi:demethylmenaquinone methyltransferase/2-methoxy-6-polyprenyl-1,4-benzoquinol methylase